MPVVEVPRTAESVRRELWYRGSLRHLMRRGPQRDAYDWIKSRPKEFKQFAPHVANFHRRLGKTFLGAALGIETSLEKPRRRSKFATRTITMAQDLLGEQWATIMTQCPGELQPKPWKNELFRFWNPRWGLSDKRYSVSTLRLYGVEGDRGDKMRGGSTDTAILDECREMADLDYTWTSVLLPTFRGREHPLGLMISTPPDSMDHPWGSKYIPLARERDRYRCVPAAEDPNWTDEEDEMFAREMGGRDSPDYRREIQCELISDSSNLIIPEFAAQDTESPDGVINRFITSGWEKPEHYYAYTLADTGGAGGRTDRCGIVFGLVDFHAGTFVQLAELFLRDQDTETLYREWKGKCQELFGDDLDTGRCRGLTVGAETRPQQIIDWSRLYRWHVSPVPTHDKDVQRRYVRTQFNLGRFRVSEECEETIYQLRHGQRNPRTGDFSRSERLGHCDLVAALIALYRILDFDENPTPPVRYARDEYYTPPTEGDGEGWNQFFRKASKPW